jgi:hypothetical protein
MIRKLGRHPSRAPGEPVFKRGRVSGHAQITWLD